MLDSIFIVIFIVAFLLTILAEREESLIYALISLVIWLMLFPQALWITDVGEIVYHEWGLSAICLGFVLVNLVLSIMYVMDWRQARRMP